MTYIEIRSLGPIRYCKFPLKDFTILTGAQAAGKSTLAKVVYYFSTLGQDIFAQIISRRNVEDYHSRLEQDLQKRLRSKFLQTFGSSWSMEADMKISCAQDGHVLLEVFLQPDPHDAYRNYVAFTLGEQIREFVNRYEDHEYVWDVEQERAELWQAIQAMLDNPYHTVYIPAGRSTITLLTDRLGAIIDGSERLIDYCTRKYMSLTSDLRIRFREGTRGLLDEALHTTQAKVAKKELQRLQQLMDSVLQGKYTYRMGEERLEMPNHRYVKINFASSGQQETVWVFNLLYYYMLSAKPTFIIIEEPESHLFPDAQKMIAEALGVFGHNKNRVLVTTHSPYILGEFNNLLYAPQIEVSRAKVEKVIPQIEHLPVQETAAFYLAQGKLQIAMEEGLIRNELIDGASDAINEEMERLLNLEEEAL
ncbi:MAG: AAA family ATPase [Selenomonas sp.]|nr:AAA family ATPase [Selenomonas sp.]